MKTAFHWITVAVAISPSLFAEIPEAVMTQLREDLKAAMVSRGGAATDTEAKTALSELESAPSFKFTARQLTAFQSDKSVPTDAEIQKGFAEIRKEIGETPLPHVLAFYDTKRAAGGLSAKQKILCLRLCAFVLDHVRKAPSESK
jgi:hypothetical protein